MRLLDLFSGIGGFSLGLESTGGFETVAFCEIEPYCQQVLAQHWPKVPCYGDIRQLTAARLAADGIAVDAICGGFPCQDISTAGGRAGLEGARSGLWGEYRRLIGELRPSIVIVENVTGLLSLGLGTVLGDLAALGYDAFWDCVPASAVGAPHQRDRLWLVAYPHGNRLEAHSNVYELRHAALHARHARHVGAVGSTGRWDTARPIGAVAVGMGDGIPGDVDRLKGLGNAVVPQVAALIGRAALAGRAAA